MRVLMMVLSLTAMFGAGPVLSAADATSSGLTSTASTGPVSIAAASSLRPALDTVLLRYAEQADAVPVRVTYGSSGKLLTQIEHGAPFDLLLAADMQHPQRLLDDGFALAPVLPLVRGRLALWTLQGTAPELADLADPRWRRIAIANPLHAPYGQRAQESLHAAGLLDSVQPRLVFGENIGQAAQMVGSGAADAGLVALSLLRGPNAPGGDYRVIDADLHAPLLQGMVLTRRGGDPPGALALLSFLQSDQAYAVFADYGFERPQE